MDDHKSCVYEMLTIVIEHCVNESIYINKNIRKIIITIMIKKLEQHLLNIFSTIPKLSKKRDQNIKYGIYKYDYKKDIGKSFFRLKLLRLGPPCKQICEKERIINNIFADIIDIFHKIFNYVIKESILIYTFYKFGWVIKSIKESNDKRFKKPIRRHLSQQEHDILFKQFSITYIKPFTMTYCINNNIQLPRNLQILLEILPRDIVFEIGSYLYVIVGF